MMTGRSSWIWGGRIVAVIAVALLTVYLWHVGLSKANALAGVLSLLVAVVALVAPYLLRPGSSHSDSPPVKPQLSTSSQPGVSAVISDSLTQAGTVDGVPMSSQESSARPPHMRDSGAAANKDSWVAAMMMFADMEDPDFRRTVLRQMGDRLNLGRPFAAPYRPMARDHVVEIVNRCWDFSDPGAARRALVGALASLRPDDRATDNLERILTGDR